MRDLLERILKLTIGQKDNMESLVTREVTEALKIVSKPCGRYMLSKNLYNEFLNTSNMEEALIKEFARHMPVAGWVTTNPFYILLLCYVMTFLAVDDYESAKTTARFYSAVTCGYLKSKYFAVCDEEALAYTMNHLHGSSIAKGNFNQLILKAADETLNKYVNAMINDFDSDCYYRYIVDVRNKLNQAVKIIAHRYYENKEKTRTESLDVVADKIMKNFNDVTSNPKVFEYIAEVAQTSEYEVESFFVKLENNNDAIVLIHDLVVKTMFHYGDVSEIESQGYTVIVFKARRMHEFLDICRTVLGLMDTHTDITNITILLTLAVLLIGSYRQ